MRHIVVTSMPDETLAVKWNTFLADASFATHYMTPNYFTDPYIRGDRFAILVMDDGDVAAVMTGVVDNDKIVSGLFSRPQMAVSNSVDHRSVVTALTTGLDEVSRDRAPLIELHAWENMQAFSDHGMQMQPSNGGDSVVMLDLSLGADAIFKQFARNRRLNICNAEKLGLVEVREIETEAELAELYKIHCDWNYMKGKQPDTFAHLQVAASQRDNRRIFIAKAGGKVIAGSFYRFCPGGVVEYAANFSLPENQRLRPNDLLVWHAIQWACGEGFSHFSMGGSHFFLRRFGGEVMTTYRYTRDDRPFGMHRLTDSVRVLGLNTYKRLPEPVRAGVRRVLAK